ncbi:MAG: hypothetical protein ACF8NJ_04720, partial [Phycisphaerales bacterium JB038]
MTNRGSCSAPTLSGGGAVLPWLLGAMLCLVATGCTPILRGKVVSGEVSFVAIVKADDPRLERPGLANVTIQFNSDPDSLGRKPLGQAITDEMGWLEMPIELPAAGLARYEIEVIARHSGYAHARGTFILPGDDERVL